jgi:hypothetical protein
MHTYRLEVKLAGKWERVCEIEADSHRAAFRKAMLCLEPKHYEMQIRLVQIKRKHRAK